MTRRRYEGTDYAGFFHPNRDLLVKLRADPKTVYDRAALRRLMERHTCGLLAEALAEAELGWLAKIQSALADSPDCWAELDGRAIGLEVAELVSHEARRVAGAPPLRTGPLVWADEHAIEPEGDPAALGGHTGDQGQARRQLAQL